MNDKRIAWAITGAGHALEKCVEVLLKHENVDVFLSRAAEEVVRMYALDTRLNTPRVRIYRETSASSPLVGRLFSGIYRVLVVAPATSNSIAKFVHGISDTLVTNLFAQAGKARVPIRVFPTDLVPEVVSLGPRQVPVTVYPRAIDLENTHKLAKFDGVVVIPNPEELESILSSDLSDGARGDSI
ncbi:MAG: flavoprotein [Acidobacteria bacterium]|nr:flavoprotein [Acidobacteriota bacterium]